MPTLAETRTALVEKREAYKSKYESFPLKKLTDGSEARDIPANELKTLNDILGEIEPLQVEYDSLTKSEKAARDNEEFLTKGRGEIDRKPISGKSDQEREENRKSVGAMFIESKGFTEFDGKRAPAAELDVDVKTLFQTTAGFAPQAIRTGRVVLSAQRPPQVIDALPQGETDQNAVVYMRETTFTNNADATAEGGQYGEAALVYTEQNDAVRKVAVFIPVTDEQMADAPGMRSLVDNRLTLMLQQKLDNEAMNGSGTAPHMQGFLNTPGIQTQAKGADPVFDAVLKAITKVNSTSYDIASAIMMNATDWMNCRLVRTADGLYILGNPDSDAQMKLWGLPVVETNVLAAGTALTADFLRQTQLTYRSGIELEVSNSHSDFFIKGQLAIRAQVRAVVERYKPTALCTVTGL